MVKAADSNGTILRHHLLFECAGSNPAVVAFAAFKAPPLSWLCSFYTQLQLQEQRHDPGPS